MMVRYVLYCLKHKPNGRYDFLIEWQLSQEAIEQAQAAHEAKQHWDSVKWEPIMVHSKLQPLAAGGWNVPAKQQGTNPAGQGGAVCIV